MINPYQQMAIEELGAENYGLKLEIRAWQEEAAASKSQFEKCQDDNKMVRAESERRKQMCHQLQTTNEGLRTEIDRLKERLEECCHGNKVERRVAEECFTNLKAENEKLEAEVKRLNDVRFDHELGDVCDHVEIKKLKAEIERLKAAHHRDHQSAIELENLKQTLRRFKQALAGLAD